jgi:putative transposase
VIANPKALRKNIKKLIRAHRRLSRRTKGGKNRAKARKRLARMYYHVGNIRKDALHKATSLLTAKPKREKVSPKQGVVKPKPAKKTRRARPTTIVLENLNVAGMKKNRKLARAISDVGMYEFKRQMLYKAEWMMEALLLADRFYPSTKRCSRCGHVKEHMDLSERVYICEQEGCGLMLDRDLNAALNLVALV